MQSLPIRAPELASTNTNCHICNQAQTQVVNGDLHFHHHGNQDRPNEPQRGYERCSVPIPIVATYTERASLSRELVCKLQSPLRGAEIAHGVTIIGLGGTGKTQLVLRYIEKHKATYDAVFWIDAQNEATARSSFAHCCQQVNIPTQGHKDKKELQDSPFVHMFLHWLACRGNGQEWLVVVDNADDLTWGVRALTPKGRMGTVIVTSHDRDASTLLNEKSEIINVDAMTIDESRSLLLKAINSQWLYAISSDTDGLLKTTVEQLDKLPLAIDLAGRRIRTVARTRQVPCGSDGEESLKSILREYLNDLRLHRRELLGDTELCRTPSYQKTVWTVWETSLASLQKYGRYNPVQLLSLMARLGGSDIHTELFQQASSGLSAASEQLGVEIPSWLGEMLKLKDDGSWDDFVYREAVDILQRFGIVRPLHGFYPGVAMHGLLKWRAAEEAASSEEWTWFLVFVVAVCLDGLALSQRSDSFFISGPHMLIHLPTTTDLVKKKTCLSDKALAWAWMSISSLLERGSRWTDCEELHEAVLSLHLDSLGERHTTTTSSKLRLDELRVRRGKSERERAQKTRTYGEGFEPVAETGPALAPWSKSLAVRRRPRRNGELKFSYGGPDTLLDFLDESQSVSDPGLQSKKSGNRFESKRPSRNERVQSSYGVFSSVSRTDHLDESQSESDWSTKSSDTVAPKRRSRKEKSKPLRGPVNPRAESKPLRGPVNPRAESKPLRGPVNPRVESKPLRGPVNPRASGTGY